MPRRKHRRPPPTPPKPTEAELDARAHLCKDCGDACDCGDPHDCAGCSICGESGGIG
jgi:hypothetical protein